MKILKSPIFLLILSYSLFMLYKTPMISDSIILIGLCSLLGFDKYLEFKKTTIKNSSNTNSEKLRDELEQERLRILINQAKNDAARQTAAQDEKNAGGINGKRFVF